MFRFIDIGANLTDLMFTGFYNNKTIHENDLKDVIDRSLQGHIQKIIITCGCLSDCIEAIKLCQKYDPECTFLYITVGVHPTRVTEFISNSDPEQHSTEQYSNDYLDKLSNIIINNKDRVVAIGEFGLDTDRLNYSSYEIQLKYFEFQFILVKKFNLPLFLHLRGNSECFDDFIRITNKYREDWIKNGAVIHSFTGNQDQLQKVIDNGFDIGINGCSLKTDENLRNLLKIPIERLHIETDSPWCEIKTTHASYKYIDTMFKSVSKPNKWKQNYLVKGRNEPVKIIQVAEVIYKYLKLGFSFEEFVEKIYANSSKIFFPLMRVPFKF